jgi:hypothetical protein
VNGGPFQPGYRDDNIRRNFGGYLNSRTSRSGSKYGSSSVSNSLAQLLLPLIKICFLESYSPSSLTIERVAYAANVHDIPGVMSAEEIGAKFGSKTSPHSLGF